MRVVCHNYYVSCNLRLVYRRDLSIAGKRWTRDDGARMSAYRWCRRHMSSALYWRLYTGGRQHV